MQIKLKVKTEQKPLYFKKSLQWVFFKSKVKLISYLPNIVLLPAFQSKGILFSRDWNVCGLTAAEPRFLLRHSFQSFPPLRSYWPGAIESLIIYFFGPWNIISRFKQMNIFRTVVIIAQGGKVGRLSANAKNAFNSFIWHIFANSRQKLEQKTLILSVFANTWEHCFWHSWMLS